MNAVIQNVLDDLLSEKLGVEAIVRRQLQRQASF